MSTRVTCPHCSAAFAAGPQLQGRRVKCPRCGGAIQIPAGQPSPIAGARTPSASPDGPNGEPSNNDRPKGKGQAQQQAAREKAAREKAAQGARFRGATAESAAGAAAAAHAGHHPAHHLGSSEAVSVAALEHPEADDEGSVGFGGKERADNAEMDMTPMVDVTFLLLIFFMVTASFTMQKSMQLPRSKTDEPSTQTIPDIPEEEPIAITVIVDSFNTFTVETAEWIREAPSEQELLIALRDAMQGSGEPPQKLTVKAHVDAFHQKAVAALDAGAEVGIQQLQYSTITEDP